MWILIFLHLMLGIVGDADSAGCAYYHTILTAAKRPWVRERNACSRVEWSSPFTYTIMSQKLAGSGPTLAASGWFWSCSGTSWHGYSSAVKGGWKVYWVNVIAHHWVCWKLSVLSLHRRLCWSEWPVLGLCSLSERTSYRKISLSLEAARFGFRLFQSPWNLTGSSTAALPRCLSNIRAIWWL